MTDSGSTRSGFVSQASWLAVGRVVAAGVSAAWFVIAARSLSLGEFGSLALLLGLGMMMSIVTDLGLSGMLTDVVASDSRCARSAARVVIRKRMLLSMIAAVLTAVAYVTAGGQGSWAVPALFAISTFATAAYSTYTAAFRALGHAGYEGTNEACSRLLLLLAGGCVVLLGGGSLLAIVAAYVAVDVASLLVLGLVFARTTAAEGPDVDARQFGLRAVRSLAAAGIVSTFYFRVDTWLLALVKGDRVVGRYAAAYRCFDALLLPALAVSSLSIPHTAGLEGEALRRRLVNLGAFAAAVTAPLALAAFVGADWLVTLVFGAKFAPAATALQILAVGSVITAVTSSVLPPLALRSGRVAIALGCSLALNVAANLLVIPSYGASGAASVTVGSELLLCIWLAAELRKLSRPGPVLVGAYT